MIRTLFLALCTFGLLQAADITGKWTGPVPGRGGQARDTTFTFKQDGNKLTGSMSGRQGDVQIEDGKVEGDKISFSVATGQAKSIFKGTVSGSEIKFTREREGAEPVSFTAKRPIT